MYDVHEITVTPRSVAGVRAQVRRGKVGAEFGRYLDQVYAAGKAGALALDGQNIFIYRSAEGETLSVDFCVGIKAPFSGAGNVVPLQTPSGVAAMTRHVGDYGKLGDAHSAVNSWCQSNNRKLAGPSWEVYGHWNEDPAKVITEIYYLLR